MSNKPIIVASLLAAGLALLPSQSVERIDTPPQVAKLLDSKVIKSSDPSAMRGKIFTEEGSSVTGTGYAVTPVKLVRDAKGEITSINWEATRTPPSVGGAIILYREHGTYSPRPH